MENLYGVLRGDEKVLSEVQICNINLNLNSIILSNKTSPLYVFDM